MNYEETLKELLKQVKHRFPIFPSFNEVLFDNAGERYKLFIGDHHTAKNTFMLGALEIKTVFTVCPEKQDTTTFHIPVDDNTDDDIYLKTFLIEERVMEKIQVSLQTGNVLVHCHKGTSRSATVVACYLMTYLEMTKEEAIQTVKNNRLSAFKTIVFPCTLQHFSYKIPNTKYLI